MAVCNIIFEHLHNKNIRFSKINVIRFLGNMDQLVILQLLISLITNRFRINISKSKKFGTQNQKRNKRLN